MIAGTPVASPQHTVDVIPVTSDAVASPSARVRAAGRAPGSIKGELDYRL